MLRMSTTPTEKEESQSFREPADWRLFDAEIRASSAYADALAGPGILTGAERDAIVNALKQIKEDYDSGKSKPPDQDVFTAIENRLGEIAGAAAGKLHAGRSRNE